MGAVGQPGVDDMQECYDQEKHDCDEQRLTMGYGSYPVRSQVRIHPKHLGGGNYTCRFESDSIEVSFGMTHQFQTSFRITYPN